MTTKTFWLVCFLLVAFPAFANDENPGEMFLVGLGETGTAVSEHNDFFVRWDSIPWGTEWKPELSKFPLELGSAANRARSLLNATKHLTNNPTVEPNF